MHTALYLRISASVKPSTLFFRARGLPLFFGFLSSSLSSVSLSEPEEWCFSLEPTSLSLSLAWAWKNEWTEDIAVIWLAVLESDWTKVFHLLPSCWSSCFWATWRCPPSPAASPLPQFCAAAPQGWCHPIPEWASPQTLECFLPCWRN